jgi:hypothetical protein
VVKESIHVSEHERRAPELALALDPRASRGDRDSKSGSKIGSKRGERRRQLTTLSAVVILATSPYGTKRFVHCFLLFFFQSSTNSA